MQCYCHFLIKNNLFCMTRCSRLAWRISILKGYPVVLATIFIDKAQNITTVDQHDRS